MGFRIWDLGGYRVMLVRRSIMIRVCSFMVGGGQGLSAQVKRFFYQAINLAGVGGLGWRDLCFGV